MKVIDVHTHGIGGVDTRSASVDTILRIAEIHGASGVSEIVLSIYSAPIQAMRRQVELVRKAMQIQGPGSRVQGQRGTRSGSERSGSAVRPATARVDRQAIEALGPRNTRERVPDPGPGRQARIIGVHLEGPFLNPARCGALDPASFIEPLEQAFHELVEGFDDIIKMITVAPELRGAPALIKR